MRFRVPSPRLRPSPVRSSLHKPIMRSNIAREKFPNTIVASMFNFVRADQLQIEFAEGGREAPKIAF